MDNLKDFYCGKKVLITGHTGFKGSWLTQILVDWGCEVIGYSLESITKPSLFAVLGLRNKIKHYTGDICDLQKLNAVIANDQPEIIFHLAAQPLVRISYDEPYKTIRTNVLGTTTLLEALQHKHSVKSVVIITTDKVYKNKESTKPYVESDPLGGYDPYSASKAAAEIITHAYAKAIHKDKIPIATARAGNVIGGGDWSQDRLIPDIVKAWLVYKEELIIRSPHAVRPWQHVLEPLSGYLLLAKQLYEGKNVQEAWNFAPNSGNCITVQSLLQNTQKILKQGAYKIEEDVKKHETTLLTLDASKAQKRLRWKRKLNIDETLQWTFIWYDKHFMKEDMVLLTQNQIKTYFEKK